MQAALTNSKLFSLFTLSMNRLWPSVNYVQITEGQDTVLLHYMLINYYKLLLDDKHEMNCLFKVNDCDTYDSPISYETRIRKKTFEL